MPIESGMKLGPYQMLEQIGVGGMGEVHKAIDTRLNRTAAIKVLPPRFSENEEIETRRRSLGGPAAPTPGTANDIGVVLNWTQLLKQK
jgi:serine/threonine protein kinase